MPPQEDEVEALRPFRHWRKLRSDRSGETALEYGLIAAALAIAIAATAFALGNVLGKTDTATAASLPAVGGPPTGTLHRN